MNVIINGVSSDTLSGVQILSLPPITKPRMRTSIATIDGRAGDIVTRLGYEAYNKSIKVLLHDNYDLDSVESYFNSAGTIVFSNEPDKEYKFETIESIDFERAVKFKTAQVTFHVQPWKHEYEETPVEWEKTAIVNKTPYLIRPSLVGGEVEDKIVGGTIVFNQLCNSSSVTVTNGHKYLLKKGTAWSVGASTGTAITGLTSGSDMVIDLTLFWNSTIADYIYSLEQAHAGDGVSYFRSLFSADYYSYNAHELMSVKTSGKKITGFNQWDEEWEVGDISESNGQNANSSTAIRSKNYIRVIPNATYFVKVGSVTNLLLRARFYDANKNFIGTYAEGGSSVPYGGTFVVPSNACYMRFCPQTSYGTTYNNDICINISKTSGSPKNGDYEPYTSTTYPLSNIDLRGVYKLDANNNLYCDGDIYEADGSVDRKFRLVDLGSINWTYYQTSGHNTFNSGFFSSVNHGDGLCSAYVKSTATVILSQEDKTWITYLNSSGKTRVSIRDDAYTSAEAFKTAMNGEYIIVELITHDTETTDPFTSLQLVYEDGTEEYIDTRTVAIPVGHESNYYETPDIELENEGNTNSAPKMTLEGSGTVTVYLDGTLIFTITMPQDGIMIDGEERNAYSDGHLANRSVVGSYDNFVLTPGTHHITFGGNVTEATFENVSRWV